MRWPWQKAPELNLGSPIVESADGDDWRPETLEVSTAPPAMDPPPGVLWQGPDPSVPPLLGANQRWEGAPGADDDDIDRLALAAQGRLPTGFLRFLGWSNGGQGTLAVDPGWIELDDTAFLILTLEDPDLAVLNASFLMIGKGREGQWIALDLRADGVSPVVWIDDVLLDGFETFTREAEINAHVHPIAPDFDALLPLIGTILPQGED